VDRIQVDHVSKVYRLGERHNLRETVGGLVRGRRPGASELWSLRDVSFTVRDGEAVGIVGRNGAGKSTMLKVLMRITTPTSGTSRTRGRVAALLEVGTGFHPELTGRENIYLNAAVLGMSRADTARRFDEIVDFAGTEQFLDTPVKRYSSGMYLRLAFAVAAHLEPDVLIVDEVLAVGDAEFQRKCLRRMSDAGAEGRTVLFVSHDLATLSKLCTKALWLESGHVRDEGETGRVVRDYLSSGVSRAASSNPARGGGLLGVSVEATTHDRPALMREDPLSITVDFEVVEERLGLDLGVFVTNDRGVRVFDETISNKQSLSFPPGQYRAVLAVPPVLNQGDHTVGVWLGTQHEDVHYEPAACPFTLLGAGPRLDRTVVLDLPFDVQRLDAREAG
jgi:ABC-2 type transport system ATP-binding protein/lipopolysaccharide transport system ATP-binding protein